MDFAQGSFFKHADVIYPKGWFREMFRLHPFRKILHLLRKREALDLFCGNDRERCVGMPPEKNYFLRVSKQKIFILGSNTSNWRWGQISDKERHLANQSAFIGAASRRIPRLYSSAKTNKNKDGQRYTIGQNATHFLKTFLCLNIYGDIENNQSYKISFLKKV